MKLWKGRFQKEADPKTNDFNSSISIDSRMYREDIEGSMAHATMLGACGIIEKGESEKIVEGLQGILADLDSGALMIDPDAEDIHTFVEGELTARIGDAGKRLHTARSRNDQVALGCAPVPCARTAPPIQAQLKRLCASAVPIRRSSTPATVMPGYTHLQRAQPITFGHHLHGLCRDAAAGPRPPGGRVEAHGRHALGQRRPGRHHLPPGPDHHRQVAGLFPNHARTAWTASPTGTSASELAFDASLIMVHLSRFCEEMVLWCSWEFQFIELDDAFSTGSSIMPQKKNPDIAELVRGKTRPGVRRSDGPAHHDEGPAPGLQQGHAGGQGGRVRRGGHPASCA